LVAKRRSTVNLIELPRLAERQPDRSWRGFWYHQRLLARQLQPVCQISYGRTARVALTPLGPIRLTLDEGVQAVPIGCLAFKGVDGNRVLSENQIILELKFRRNLPVLFKLLVEKFALNPQPISKYRLAVAALGFVKPEPIDPAPPELAETTVCLTS